MSEEVFCQIDYKTAVDFLLPRHYSGRKPSITKAFGVYQEDVLKAVCTFGKPASPKVCEGVCGKEFKNQVYELNRLCRDEDYNKPLSKFVSWCLRQLKKENWIIISYSDTAMNHHGYIYQACNFIYTGMTKQRTDLYTPNGKHPRHYQGYNMPSFRKVRSSKHRYVYFCGSKSQIKIWRKHFMWTIIEYPKGDNSNYILGEYIKDQFVCNN